MERRRRTIDSVLEGALASDIFIPVMGPTKSGKSYFLNQLLDSPVFEVSHGLASCTTTVSSFTAPPAPEEYAQLNTILNGRRIVLVDTPGFDDTDMGDEEVLILISEWLTKSYNKGMHVGGALYLHDITRDGNEVKSLSVFSKVCGQGAMDRVAIVTTKWDRLENIKDGEDKLGELCDRLRGKMLAKGAHIFHLQPQTSDADSPRTYPLHTSPWEIIYSVVVAGENRDINDQILQIQDEIANRRLLLPDTDAGKELQMSLDSLLKKADQLKREAAEDNPRAARAAALLESRRRAVSAIIAELERLRPPGILTRAKRWFRNRFNDCQGLRNVRTGFD